MLISELQRAVMMSSACKLLSALSVPSGCDHDMSATVVRPASTADVVYCCRKHMFYSGGEICLTADTVLAEYMRIGANSKFVLYSTKAAERCFVSLGDNCVFGMVRGTNGEIVVKGSDDCVVLMDRCNAGIFKLEGESYIFVSSEGRTRILPLKGNLKVTVDNQSVDVPEHAYIKYIEFHIDRQVKGIERAVENWRRNVRKQGLAHVQ